MTLKENKAFTLVELIVVITILAILGTIAFLSFQGYSKDARDSTRITDLGNIETSIELFLQLSSKLPVPDNKTDITFSGSVAWYQGVFGDTNTINVDKLNEKPVDPITGNEYAYSTTAYGNEYELATILEGGLTDNSKLSTLKHATATGAQIATAYIVGNYNQKFLRTRVSNLDYVLAVPSIIASDINDATLESILSNGNLVYRGYSNLPANYSNTTFNTNPTPGFEYTNSDPIIYTGSLNELTETLNQTRFVNNLKSAYSGSILTEKSSYKEIIDININNQQEINQYIANITSNNDGGIPDLGLNTYEYLNSGSHQELRNMFKSGSLYTKYWNSNSCDADNLNVIEISPGVNKIPSSLANNTIYKLSDGNYILSYSITGAGCGGLIGTGESNIYTSDTISQNQITGLGSNSIYGGINIDGVNDGVGGTHNPNSGDGIHISGNNTTVYNFKISYNGLGFRFDGDYNHGFNLISYNNSSRGMLYGGDYGSYFNIRTYNNGGSGIDSTGSNNTLSNAISYDNVSSGIEAGGNGAVYNNVVSFNNGSRGVLSYGNPGVLFNNISSYNNSGDGFELYSNVLLVNQLHSYNNTIHGFDLLGSPTFYGVSNSSTNDSGDSNTPFTFGNDGYIGLSNGSMNTGGSYSSSNAIIPSASGWHASVSTRGNSAATYNGLETYSFGSSIPAQLRPIKYNPMSGNHELFGENGVDYDSSKYIGQW